ncbi:SRPBCC domain-containing protein [Micromonospora sp. NPDC093277]|uniref:SRPBCC domain-containing protein n=1 Tax=Micromonospora sp. NPDC093277 TaxID=3364291 RepID=UPI00380CDAD4
MTTTTSAGTTKVYRVYIKATPQAIWDAITKPEWTQRYGYQGIAEFDLRPGGGYRARATPEHQQAGMPAVLVEGEVIEVEPPVRLVQTWRATWLDEPATRLTYEIQERGDGISSLTVTHELADAPQTLTQVDGQLESAGGGWPEVLSDLKTLLETGRPLHP